MRFIYRLAIVITLLTAVAGGTARCDSWTVQQLVGTNPYGGHTYRSIVFIFDGTYLTLNTNYIETYDMVATILETTLIASGNWAVCGSVRNGEWTPDPYATFVIEGNGGHIEWAFNTPAGYITDLLLGASFIGNGAARYDWTMPAYGYPVWQSGSVTATLIRDYRHDGFWPSECYAIVQPVSHTFVATYPVPEPSSILALICGLGSIAYWRRKLH